MFMSVKKLNKILFKLESNYRAIPSRYRAIKSSYRAIQRTYRSREVRDLQYRASEKPKTTQCTYSSDISVR